MSTWYGGIIAMELVHRCNNAWLVGSSSVGYLVVAQYMQGKQTQWTKAEKLPSTNSSYIIENDSV